MINFFFRKSSRSAKSEMDSYNFEISNAKSKDVLNQGSQTQSDSRAAWNSKKGLVGRIEKSEKNYLQIFI